jgi:6-phosphofructokinase 1
MTDRVLALRLGCAATRFLASSTESGLVAVRGPDIKFVPLDEGTQRIRTVAPDSNVLQTARDLGLCFGDEPLDTFQPSLLPPRP